MPKDIMKPGQTFHLPAAQEKNIGNLMNILSKKEATDALTTMGETSKETWGDIKETVISLKDIVDIGGTTEILQSIMTQVEESLAFAIDGALSPITNTLNTIIGTTLAPVFDTIAVLSNQLASFVEGKETGAFFGAMIGSIWGPATQLIGGIIGAAIEGLIDWMGMGLQDIQGAWGTIDPWEAPWDPRNIAAWIDEFGTKPDLWSAEYFAWFFERYTME